MVALNHRYTERTSLLQANLLVYTDIDMDAEAKEEGVRKGH